MLGAVANLLRGKRPPGVQSGMDSVRMRLLGLVVLLLLPGLALAALVTWRSYRADRVEAETDLRDAATTLGKIVDAELDHGAVRLRLLAATDMLARGDIPAFAGLARVAAKFGTRIVLRDAADHRLVDTGAGAHGLPIPWTFRDARGLAMDWVQDDGGMSDLLMTMPVELGGRHIYNLTAIVPQAALQATLPQLRLPDGWIATLYDADQHVVARSMKVERFRGKPPSVRLDDALRQARDVVADGVMPDGDAMIFAASRSPLYGVAVSIEAPDSRISKPSRLSLILLVCEGGALVVLGLIGASRVANSISRPIEALAVAARHLGDQTPLPAIPGGLMEADEVAQAMQSAHGALIERRAALSELNATLAARVAARTAELAQANQALEEQRSQLGLILDHIPVGVLVTQFDGMPLYANPEVRRLLGMTSLDFASILPLRIRQNGIQIETIEAPPARARRGETTERELLTVERRDGVLFELEVSAGPVLDSAGQVALSVTTMQDVTARLAAEEARRRSQRMEAVGQLTGGVAHEFNNLLMAISGCLDLLGPHIRGERARTLLESAARAGERGGRLTSQLLAFARRQNLQAEPVDLNGLVSSMTELLMSTLGRGIEVTTRLQPDCSPAMADATQLELVLLNLAINSRDAMPGGGLLVIGTSNAALGPPRRAEAPPAGEYVALQVTDSGCGMDDEVMSRIFEPFFTTKEVGRGSGLGLPQVLGVAQQLGGGVTVESAPGHGTTISVYLPRAVTMPGETRRPAASPPRKQALQDTRILLVDDDVAVRDVARAMLEEMGAVVTQAENGPDALLLLRTGPRVDIVLADYTMPHMTGVELAGQVAEWMPGLPIVLMTGYSAASLGEHGPHIAAVLQKPFRAQAMADTLAAAMNGAWQPAHGAGSGKPPRQQQTEDVGSV